MATSLMLLLERCHYVRHVCWSGATLRYACLYSETLSDTHAGFIYPDACVSEVLLHQARNLVCYKSTRHAYRQGARLPRVYKTYQIPAWTSSWIYQILSDASAASLGCYKDDVCNSRISKIAFCMRFPGVCQSQGKFSYIFVKNCHFGGHFVCILILFLYFC